MKRKTVFRLTYSAVCLALAMVLPLITGNVPKIGNMLCPMHIPVLLCGFICGSRWGLAVGAVAPVMKSALFGAPVMLPMALSMAFELAAYGAVAGLLGKRLSGKGVFGLYASLLGAMVSGRVVWGAARVLLSLAMRENFPLSAFVAGAFTNAIPGIVIQLVLIPPTVAALRHVISSSDGELCT